MKTARAKRLMHVAVAGITSMFLVWGVSLPVYALPVTTDAAQAALSAAKATARIVVAADDPIDNGYDFTFFVNDLRTRADVTPGDGICSTGETLEDEAPACTLYAAIQEANATAEGKSILIVPADSMRAYNGTWSANGLINVIKGDEAGSAPDMLPTWSAMQAATKQRLAVDGDLASRYHVAHDDVTLDFQNRLGFTMNRDAGSYAMFVFSGANQTLRNMSELTSCEGGIYIGATATNTLIENSFLGNPPLTTQAGYALERALQIVEGATDTTLRNLSFSRNYQTAIGFVSAADTTAKISGLVIEGADFYWTNNGGGHDHAWSYALYTWHNDVLVDGMEFRGNTIRDWGIDGGVTDTIYLDGNAGASQWKNVRFFGNTFERNFAAANLNHIQISAMIVENFVIEGNTFINTAYTGQNSYPNSDVYLYLSDGFTIRDNHFDSLNGSSLITAHARSNGAKNDTYRNTFTNVGGSMAVGVENTTSDTRATILRWAGNNNIRTAYATGAKVIDDPVNSCRIDVTLAPPTTTGGNAIGTDDVYVDVYIGSDADKGAETYLGRVKTTITELNDNPVKSFSYTGAGEGNYVRLQTTEIATGFTSNYSRGVAATGQDTCAPWSWTKEKGWFNSEGQIMTSQQDPTSDRLVKFEILTSEALQGGSLTEGDIEFTGNAYEATVVSLQQLSSTKWELTAKANGSGTITPSIKVGAITDLAGNANTDASNYHPGPINFSGYLDADQIVPVSGADIDTTVRYISPLRLLNREVEVSEPATTDAISITYAEHLLVDGRLTKAPQYPVNFVANWGALVPDESVPALTPAQTAPDVVELSGVLTSELTSGEATVAPINNFVHDGTRTTTFDLVVESEDPEFDGLVLNAPEAGGPLEKLDATINDDDAPDATKSSLSVRTNNALADGEAKNLVVATVRNAAGEVVSNALVTFELPADVALATAGGQTDGTTATLVTNAQGTVTAELTSLIGGQPFDIAAFLTGDEIAGSPVQVTFTSLPASAQDSHYSVSTGTRVANGTEAHTITVELATETGAPASGFASVLAASASPSEGITIGAFTESSTPGQYTAPITSSQVGTAVVSVTVNGNGITTVNPVGQNTAEFAASGVSLEDSSLAISSGSKIADGEDAHLLTVTLIDATGNMVTGYADQLEVVDASGDLVTSTFSETAPGVYKVSVSTTVAGTYPITVKVGEDGSLGPVNGEFAAGVVDAGSSELAVTVSPRSVDDIGTDPHAAQVKVTDAFGNPIAGVEVLFSTSPFLTPALASSAMKVTSGEDGIAQLSLPSQKAGTYSVSATIAGNAVKDSPAQIVYSPGEVVFTATTPALSATTGSVPADGVATHTVTATVLDQFDNPVPGATVEFIYPADLNEVSVSGTETGQDGTVELVVSSNTEGEFTVTALVNGEEIPIQVPVNFWNNGPNAENSTFTVTTGPQTANGVDFHLATITLLDSQNQGVIGQSNGFDLINDDVILGEVTEVDSVDQPGVYTVEITSHNAGTFEIEAKIGTAQIGGSPQSAEFVPGPPSTQDGHTSLTSTTGTRLADGIQSHVVTLTVKDAFGNPVPGAAATLNYDADSLVTTAPGANETAGSVSVTTDENGNAIVEFTSITAGTFDVSATVTQGNLDLTAVSLSYVAGAPSASKSELTVSPTPPADVIANGTDSYSAKVTVRDEQGNPVPNRTVTFTGGSLGLSSTTATTDSSGNATITVTSTKSGEYPLKAAINAGEVTGSPTSLAFIAGAPGFEPGSTRIDASGGSVAADGTSTHTVTVRVLDALKNPVAGTTVDFTLPAGVAGPSSATSNAEGLAIIEVTSIIADTFQVTAAIDSTTITNGSPASVTFGAGAFDPHNSLFQLETTGTKVADGVDEHVVKLIAMDAAGNFVSGASVSVSLVDPNGGATLASATLTSNSEGVATTTVTSTVAGAHAIQATSSQTQLRAVTRTAVQGSPVEAVFVAGAGAAGNSTLELAPSTPLPADSEAKFTVTAQVRDANGNVVGAGTTVIFDVPDSVDPSAVSAVTDANGIASITISSAVSGTFNVAATLNGEEIDDLSYVFTAGQPSAANSTFVVTPDGPLVANDTEAYTATVTLKDQNQNLVPGQEVFFDIPAGLRAATAGPYITNQAGEVSVAFVSAVEGVYPLTAWLDSDFNVPANQIGVAADLVFETGPADASQSTIEANPTVAQANGTHTIKVTVEFYDASGSKVTDIGLQEVKILSDFGDLNGFSCSELSSCSVNITSTEPGPATLSFSIDGVASPSTVVVEFIPVVEKPTVDPTNGKTLSGRGQPGTTITVTDPDETVLCIVPVDEDGNFTCDLSPEAPNETTLTVVATDEHEFTSEPAEVVVDNVAPEAPLVDPTDGQQITGSGGEEGDVITVSDSEGNEINCSNAPVTVGADGRFLCELEGLDPALGHGDIVEVVVTDDAGNPSEPGAVTIDQVAPAKPEVEDSNGSSIGGKTDEDSEGAEVIVEGPDGPLECANAPVLVQDDGSFFCDLSGLEPPLEDGDEITIIITDESGNPSEPETIIIDKTAPAPPTVDPSDGNKVTGETEPGATIEITDEDGVVLCTTTADEDGRFECELDPVPDHGDKIIIESTDPAGNTSPPTTIITDSEPPVAPEVDPSDGNKVTGETEPGATIEITDEDGVVLCTTTADEDGRFECELDPVPDHGDKIIIESTDPAGNTSPPTTIITDSEPPVAPEVDPSNGNKVTGKGEPGSTITVKDKDGNVLCETVANSTTGAFECELTPALEDGDEIKVEATDPAGNVSPPTEVTVDGIAPEPPTVDPTDGSKVTGDAEPGSTVTITDKDGNVLCETVAHSTTGAFECVLSPELKGGTEIKVTATDPAGNTSAETVITVDYKRPAAPQVDPSDGKTVSGSAEPGSVIEVRDESGKLVCTTTADAETGKFSCVLDTPAKPGDVLSVYAINENGMISPPTAITVESSPITPPPGGGTGGNKPGGGLPTTGEAIGLLTLAALGLGAGGAGFLAIRRRRSDTGADVDTV